VDGVELSVSPVIGIEIKTVEAVAVSARDEQTMKEARPIVAAIEVEILRELLRLLVEDVQRAIHVGHEEASGAARFFADRVHARQQHLVRRLADRQPGNRHGREVSNFEGHRLLRMCDSRQK
jgi:hypothetical protein